MSISEATEDDLPQILKLVESCYRSEISKTGWTSDADMVEGQRVTIESLKKDLKAPGGKFFKYTEENGEIPGCVYTEIIAEGKKIDIGLLCVHPAKQAQGLGRKLMAAVENYGLSQGCTKATLQVVSIRDTLIAWYQRQGYELIKGEISPFTAGIGVGIPKFPLEFCTLDKPLV